MLALWLGLLLTGLLLLSSFFDASKSKKPSPSYKTKFLEIGKEKSGFKENSKVMENRGDYKLNGKEMEERSDYKLNGKRTTFFSTKCDALGIGNL